MISHTKIIEVFKRFGEIYEIHPVQLMEFKSEWHAICAMRHAIYANLAIDHTAPEISRASGQDVESIRYAVKMHKRRMEKKLTAKYDDYEVKKIMRDIGIKVDKIPRL